MSLISTSIDERLARRILQLEGNEVRAAVAFYERHQPATLDDAARLLESYGPMTPEAFDAVAMAWDVYWHLKDMPGD